MGGAVRRFAVGLTGAYSGRHRVGGVVIARHSPDVNLLELIRDLGHLDLLLGRVPVALDRPADRTRAGGTGCHKRHRPGS